MQWILISVQVMLGSLVPAFVLWLIGKKIQYDFYFWQMLTITATASLVGLIPYAGFWLQLLVYYGLFLKLTGIDLIEAIWVSFIAFLVKAAVFFGIMFSMASLMNSSAGDMKALAPPPAIENESTKPSFSESREQGGVNMVSADGSPLSRKFVNRFDISGTGKGVNGSFAIINDEIYHEGHEFNDGARVEKVARNEVVIYFEENYHCLVLR